MCYLDICFERLYQDMTLLKRIIWKLPSTTSSKLKKNAYSFFHIGNLVITFTLGIVTDNATAFSFAYTPCEFYKPYLAS